MKIVITGGNSFIGEALAEKAIEAGNEVVQIVRSESWLPAYPEVSYAVVSMEEYSRLGSITGECDCLVNLAWAGTRGAARMDRELQKNNCKYTLEGIRSVLDAGCKKIVTAGSQAEYGPHKDAISEDVICLPNTEYGIAKLELYESVASLCDTYKVSYIEPRFFSLYGPGDYPGTMIMSILKNMLQGTDCKLTEGIQMWDFLYISDAVDAVWKLCSGSYDNGAYNLGSGDVRQLKEYVLEMARITHTQSRLEFGAVPYPETGMVSIWPDISRMKRLGWKPQVSFQEGIKNILNEMGKEE